MVHFYRIHCHCGHDDLVALSRSLHRDQILPRAWCKACGRRGAADCRPYVPGSEASGWQDEAIAYANSLPVIKV